MHHIVQFKCCCCLITNLCLTLCDPTDYSLLASSVHGILQARILEWVAISFSRLCFLNMKNIYMIQKSTYIKWYTQGLS